VAQLRAHLDNGNEHIHPEEVGIFAAYEPLNSLKGAGRIAGSARLRRSEYGNLIKLQIDEPAEEADIKKTLQHIVPIEDETSKAVQGMYEENPYPRWLTCNRLCPLQDRHL